MSKALTQAVIACIEATEMTDHCLRSAIGMARTSIEPGKSTIVRTIHPGYERRDGLAEDLVKIIQGAKPEDVINALQIARARINAPFLDPEMVRDRAERLARGALVVPKKGTGKKDS